MTDLLVGFLVVAGLALLLIAAVGLVRLPDVYCRAHAMGMASTLGISLLLVALWIGVGGVGVGLKVLAFIVFQFATIPVASHLIALVARRKGVPRWGAGGWTRRSRS